MSLLKKKKSAESKLTDLQRAKLYDVLVRPVITEKATRASEQSKVVFAISPTATKPQVKQAVETLFNVKVKKVNTINIAGKTKRFRGVEGKRDDLRKAVITLEAGQTIDVAAGVR
jgi:large subunit ribosomal protein L23